MSARSKYDRWPKLLRECAEELGEDAALKLADKLGGQRIYVGDTDQAKRITQAVGPEIADFLKSNYGAHILRIPSFSIRMRAEERRQHVLQNPDIPANALAAELNVSSRWIEKIRQNARRDPRQLSLF